MAGKRKNDDSRNQLMHSYIEFIKLVQPTMLFFENVQGFTVGFKDHKDKPPDPANKSMYFMISLSVIKIYYYNFITN